MRHNEKYEGRAKSAGNECISYGTSGAIPKEAFSHRAATVSVTSAYPYLRTEYSACFTNRHYRMSSYSHYVLHRPSMKYI